MNSQELAPRSLASSSSVGSSFVGSHSTWQIFTLTFGVSEHFHLKHEVGGESLSWITAMSGEGHRLPRWIHRGCSVISAAARLRQQLLEAARSLGLRQEACAPVMVSSPVSQSSGCLSAVASGSTVRFRLCAHGYLLRDNDRVLLWFRHSAAGLDRCSRAWTSDAPTPQRGGCASPPISTAGLSPNGRRLPAKARPSDWLANHLSGRRLVADDGLLALGPGTCQAVRLHMLCDSPEAFVKEGSGSVAV